MFKIHTDVWSLGLILFFIFIIMSKIQRYYYKDTFFQLELNLQTVRRGLLHVLDNETGNECFSCNQLKCSCDDMTSGWNSWSLTDDESLEYKVPPPPEKLPTPEWSIRIYVEKWITDSIRECNGRSSVSEQSDKAWPPQPKSKWCDDQKKANRLRKESEGSSVGSVEDFFQYFSQRMLQND